MSFDFHIPYLAVSIIVSSGICIYAWRHPKTRGSRSFAVAGFACIIWMFGDLIGRLSPAYTGQWIGEMIRYLGIELLPVALLVFIYRYCGNEISRRGIVLLSIIPLVSWCVMATNPWHELFFTSTSLNHPGTLKVTYGPYFWFVHVPYCYLLLINSFLLVLIELNRASRHYRKPLIILFCSLCIPFVFNVIGILKLIGGVSYTPTSFPVFFAVMAIAIFRYRFLGSNPIAFETVFQTIRDGVVILDRSNIIMDVNRTAAGMLAKKPVEVIGQSFREAFSHWPELSGEYEGKPDFYDEVETEISGHRRSLSVTVVPLKNSKGNLNGRIITFRDITDRKRYEYSLETLAFHDPLTLLANRLKFQQEVETAIKKSRRSGKSFAILFFDLNRFKAVNDELGHEVGDELLKYVAARIVSLLRKPDLLARIGGDEFAILLNKTDQSGVELVAERILENIRQPFKIKEHTVTASLSIGAAFYPEHGQNISQLLRHADQAMYLAKAGGGGFAVYKPKTEPRSVSAV